MPPIEAPTTCARAMPSASSRPIRCVHRPADRAAQHRSGQIARAERVDLRRQAGIAVVEADHPEAAVHQRIDQRVGPSHQLHAQAHDEHDRRALRIAVLLDLERDLRTDLDLH
jgi:hypothetical protein